MKLFRLLHEILREIFDEAAYERFCAKAHLEADAESYAQFLRESGAPRQQKIRCC